MTEKDYSIDTFAQETGVLTSRDVEARILILLIFV